MRLRLCAALLLLTVPSYGAERDAIAEARAALGACLKQLDARVDIGYERIAARCPGLTRTLEQGGIVEWLPGDWNQAGNNLSAGGLTELRAVLERESATRPKSPAPRVERLDSILATLQPQRPPASGVWSRFKRWVRDLVDRREQPASEGWFGRMASRVGASQAVVESVSYVALAVLVVLALVIVLNELEAAGLLSRRSRAPTPDVDVEGMPRSRAVPTLKDVERAPLAERPGLLLEIVAARLTALRRLPPSIALTVGELARSAELQSDLDRERFRALAQVSERARYAGNGVPESALEAVVEQGRLLLQMLEDAEVSSPAAGARA